MKIYFGGEKADTKRKIFEKGRDMVNEELNMFNILQLLRKLKASVSIVVGDDSLKLDQIKKLYSDYSTLRLDEKLDEQFDASKSDVMKFFDNQAIKK